ncbi:unnamed protein product, partial [Cylindrotheca closterium]
MDKQEQILVMKLLQDQDAIKKGLYAFVKLHTFCRIKFPTTEEKGVRECTKAVQKSYVLLPEGVDTDVFASKWQSSLRERLRMLRNNCQNSAKKKFISDWKEGVVPQNSEASLVTNYQDYVDDDGKARDNRKDNYDSFLYFIDRILPSVNADVTKYYGDARCQFGLSNAFTVTDEAFGLLMVENYVEQWKALAKEWPSSDTTEDQGLKCKRMCSLGGRYTGSEKGMVAGGWDNGGINRFNELAQMDLTFFSDAGKWKFHGKKAVAPDFELQIQGLSGATESLRCLEPDDSERTLGVMLAPLENLEAHKAQMVVSTAAKKAGGSKSKSGSTSKKSGKKRLENASSVDLRQPKDRDPKISNDSGTKEVIDTVRPLIDFGLSTQDLVAIGYDKNSTQIEFGNHVFTKWIDDHNARWSQALPRFDSPFQDFYAKFSVEVRVNMIFDEYDNDWQRVLGFLISIFEDDDKNTEYIWGVRAIALQVAQQIPFSFFDIGLLGDSTIQQDDLYFCRDDSNPRLRQETPLVQFWLICATMFDHPWTMMFDEFLEVTPVQCIQEMKTKVIAGFPNDAVDKVEIHKGVRKIFDPEYEDSEEEDDSIGDKDNGLVNRYAQPDGWDSDETGDDSEFDNKTDDDADDDDEDEASEESVIIVESTRPTDNEYGGSRSGRGHLAETRTVTDETVSELTGNTGDESDPELASPPRKKGRSQRVSIDEQATEMDVDGTDLSICSRPSGKRLHPATRSTKPATQETAKSRPTTNAPGAKRKSQRTLTLEERLDDLRNVDLDGMEGRAMLVELGMVYSY